MIINAITDGRVLYQGPEANIKKALQTIISKKLSLKEADLRKSDLSKINLDGLQAPNSCFWGVNFKEADISVGNLEKSDFRLSDLQRACLADTNLRNCDFRGAAFQNTILDNADLSGSQFSCPTFLRQDLRFVKNMQGCTFHHLGEVACPLSKPPLYIRTALSEIFVLDHHAIIDGDLLERGAVPDSIQGFLKTETATAGKDKNTAHS